MSKKPQYDPAEIRFPNQHIVESPLVPEMEKSYIEYAMSVIVGRALPDVRDGLKPVHRRILYAMYEDNLTSDKPFKKSATCVGDVLGRYHPHGDASVYDALVRLAQDFSMRYMLVDGHGNFGSVDGDPPAAYRYTEARLSKISDEMLRDIEKDTVDWDPNFDESRKEPRVLPARFPNLLVNGSSGIAVGMATNIPPHNLREVIGACICVLDDPNASLSDLMEHIKGPDFPTKGIIMGRSGIRAAYATGRGRIVVRARHEFEEFGHDRTRIVITELPYQVNKRMLIKAIADQVEDKRLDGISDIRDESDRNGMRIVIELKRDANPQVVLNRLFAQTQLQTTFAINMLALVQAGGQPQPKILSLRHILDEYIAYQEQVQEIFKSLAGYSLGQADMVRRAMSKKKEKVLKAERQAFIYGDPERKIEGCKKRGISEETANDLFDEVMDFARYAFNKSHAACYAVVAYQTAWLKHHYPLQYMAAVLNSSDFDGIQKLCGDMRYMQIPFEAPDVNVSGAGFTIYDNAVYYGLSKIKGLGAAQAQIEEERKKNGPFRSIADFVIRTWPDAKTFEKFVRANAFRHLCDNRQALLIAWDTVYAKAIKSLKDYNKKLAATAEPDKQAKIRKSMADKEDVICQTQIDTSVCNDEYQNLKNERELLGDYFTGHPMDHYESPKELKTVAISQALGRGRKSSVRVAGIITEYTVKARRTDGRPMAFFTLSDQTGSIPICCFTEPYASYSDLLAEDTVVKIGGEIMVDTDNDAEEPIRKISVKTVEPLKPVKDMIMIMDTDPFHWMDKTKDKVVTYANPNGNPACVFFESLQEIWKTDLVLNPLIVTEAPVRCSMTKTR